MMYCNKQRTITYNTNSIPPENARNSSRKSDSDLNQGASISNVINLQPPENVTKSSQTTVNKDYSKGVLSAFNGKTNEQFCKRYEKNNR